MKLKTSFCNGTALKKNITRFSPVWGLYTVFLLMFLVTMARSGNAASLAGEGIDAIKNMPWINLFYGWICAIVLFGDLFNSRMCNALHALPLRRETWLLTHIISGVLFCLVPNTVIALIGSLLLWEHASVAWIWLAISVLQFVFFFGTGVLSAVCAGNRLAMIAIYGIIHFFSMLAYGVAELFYQPLLHGVQLDIQNFDRFFPLMQLLISSRSYVDFSYNLVGEVVVLNTATEAWRILGLCTAVGVACFVLAHLVYRCRDLERAGDFISLRPLAPVFLLIYTLGVSAVFYMFSELFGDPSYWYLAVGMVVGFFTGYMLLKRTVKVFTKKAVFKFAVFIAVFAASLVLTWLDPIGISRRIPDIQDVQWGIVCSANTDYSYSSETEDYRFGITDPVELEGIQSLHKKLVSNRKIKNDGNVCEVRVIYSLKDGSRFYRYYKVEVDSEIGQEVKRYLSDPRFVFQTEEPQLFVENLDEIYIQCYDLDLGDKWGFATENDEKDVLDIKNKKQIAGLVEAMIKDCEAGNMAQSYTYHKNEKTVFYLFFEYQPNSKNESYKWNKVATNIMIHDSCQNTISYLQQLKVRE